MGLVMNITFKVIIPCYNVEKWIGKCLDSLLNQTYTKWDAIVVNDCSTDGTAYIIKEKLTPQIRLMSNYTKHCPLYSIVYGTNMIIMKEPDAVIVILDGDDWFYDENVLEYLNEVYQDPNIWLTYGDYVHASNPDLRSINAALTSTTRYRKWRRWRTSHLRTYKNKLWLNINKNIRALMDSSGKYYTMAADVATMFPMIEMAGLKHIKYIRRILYVYNDLNPLNEHNIDRDLQKCIEDEIRAKDIYEELTEI